VSGAGGRGSLSIVGTGYRVGGHLTRQTEGVLRAADRVFYLVSDPATAQCIRGLAPDARSLHDCYREGVRGLEASNAMVERILREVREGQQVCAAFYGHPAVFMHTTHEAIRRARDEGHPARMLPAISAEDCLIADLGIDPGAHGRLLFEATDFVTRPREIDTTALLILLQVGAVGLADYRAATGASIKGLCALVEVLARYYPEDHETVLYETPHLPIFEPSIRRVPLAALPEAPVSVVSTLCVPPVSRARRDPAMLERLEIALAGSP
jgi:uncharacterized protein YabN with tetrapyrrole methylase and pyrophosphatase domain